MIQRGSKRILTLTPLTIRQLTRVYNDHMRKDFAANELKPLRMILRAMEMGIYESLGIFEGDRLTGYVLLVHLGDEYLLDYFAVFEEYRNGGIGSEALKLLSDYISDTAYVVLEVENPEYAKEPQNRELQTRRVGFYLRNGCADTGVRVTCFGVPFILLALGDSRWNAEEVRERYKGFYRKMLPPLMYLRKIRIDK